MKGDRAERRVVVLSAQEGLLEPFIRTVSASSGKTGQVLLPEGGQLQIDAVQAAELKTPASDALFAQADACVVLVRFVDRESLEQLRAVLLLLPSQATRNLHVMLCRNEGEVEFKMSCPKCGQKLMVRDALAFRRVVCPRCHEPFTIPGQTDLLRSELVLQPARLVRKVVLGDAASCRHALAAMAQQVEHEAEGAKAQTMRLDVHVADEKPEPAHRV